MVEAQFGGCVFEGAVLCIFCIAVPTAGGETGEVGAQEAGRLPGVDEIGELGREVGAAINNPAYFLRLHW